jgi:hypothetical protein
VPRSGFGFELQIVNAAKRADREIRTPVVFGDTSSPAA